MANTHDEVVAVPVPPQRPTVDTPTVTELKPGTYAWRVNVAMCAHQFFNVVHDPEVAKVIGKSIPSSNAATAEGLPKTPPSTHGASSTSRGISVRSGCRALTTRLN